MNFLKKLKTSNFDDWSKCFAVLLIFFIPISTTATNIVLFLLLFSWFLAGKLLEKATFIFYHPLARWILALFACFVLGLFYTPVSLEEGLGFLSKMSKLLYILFLLPLFSESKWRNRALLAFASAMVLTLILATLKVHCGLPIQNRFTMACVFKNHIETNLFMAFATFLIAHVAANCQNSRKRLGLIGLAAGMTFYVLGMSEGRSGYIIFAALWLLFFLQRFPLKNVFLGSIVLAVCICMAALSSHRFQNRIRLIEEDWKNYQIGETNNSLGQRLEYLENTFKLAQIHPWIGWGSGSYEHVYKDWAEARDLQVTDNPHNEYLDIFFNIGTFGFLIFLGLLGSWLKNSFQLPNFERYLVQGAWVAFILGSFANAWLLDFTPGIFFVAITGICFAAYQKRQSEFLISVVVTTYNWPEALERVLKALAAQTDRHFEVIVADDGSKEETRHLIDSFKLRFPVPLHHVWQEDQGFRAAAIRNKAIQSAKGEYIIFLDGDCIPRTDFVIKHRLFAEPKFFVTGNRVLLNEAFTKQILSKHYSVEQCSFLKWLSLRIQGHCNRILPILSFPLGSLRKLFPRSWKGAKGCNLSVWKADLLHINGWEEEFTGWGYEDSDLVLRLIRAGVFRKEARFSLPVIHLWHRENYRSQESQNWSLLLEKQRDTEYRAKQGLEKRLEYGLS